MASEPSEPESDAALAAFQSELLRMLAEGLPAQEILGRLATEPAFAPYAKLTRAMDPRALGIAVRVVKKYARRA